MNFETADFVQLIVALSGAILILVAAYSAPLKVSVGILVVLIPFQPAETAYGSANVAMTYVLATALLLNGRLRYAPMLGAMLAVVFAYLISISQLPRSVYVLHGLEVFFLVSGFLVFILTYNLARELENTKAIMKLLILCNALCVIYCLLQLFSPPGQSMTFFGLDWLGMNANRGDGDARLIGPFGTPGLTAAYFMSMTMILTYELLYSQGRHRVLVAALAAANVAMMIATANRGSFLVLLASLLWFLFVFRAELGFRRIVQLLAGSTVVLAVAVVTISTYTNYGQMLARLDATEFEGGVPDTRAIIWPRAWEQVTEKPFFGHGPRLVSQPELRFRRFPPEQLVSGYPHNLYLHLLVTVGVLGTACMLFFLLGVVRRVYQGGRWGSFNSPHDKGWVLVGTIVLVAFLVDELKIEFLRRTTVDYAHFIFALFGFFLGSADAARARARSSKKVSTVRNTSLPAVPAIASRTYLQQSR